MKEPINEIQSPIWRKKKEHASATKSGFGIQLTAVSNGKPADNPADEVKLSDRPKQLTKTTEPEKESDEVIVLGESEKNSLLLFS